MHQEFVDMAEKTNWAIVSTSKSVALLKVDLSLGTKLMTGSILLAEIENDIQILI